MSLRDWLESEGKSLDWLATQLHVSQAAIRHWIAGRHRPRDPAILSEIERLSAGRVTAGDVILRPTPRDRVGRPRLTTVS